MRIEHAAMTMLAAGLLALATPVAAEPQYCTVFNHGYLTRILTDADDCGSYPCGFYAHDFSDAVETCGDEVFTVESPAPGVAECDFCYWSNCWTVRKNSFGVTALDHIRAAPGSDAFRAAVLTSPSTQVIIKGGHGPVIDEPPAVRRATLDVNRAYLFWLVQDHTLEEAINDPSIPVFYSMTSANSDGFNHLISLTSAQNGGATVFAWEDLVGGGDNDINDVVFTTQCQFRMRPAPPAPRRPTDVPVPVPPLPVPPQAPRAPTSPISAASSIPMP